MEEEGDYENSEDRLYDNDVDDMTASLSLAAIEVEAHYYLNT